MLTIKNRSKEPSKQLKNLFDEHLCVVCNARYTNSTALGQLQCFEHPCDIYNGEFLCCRLRTTAANKYEFYAKLQLGRAKGCVRADHNMRHVPYSGVGIDLPMRMPNLLLQQMNLRVLSQNVRYEEEDDNVTIFFRFNEADYQRLLTLKPAK